MLGTSSFFSIIIPTYNRPQKLANCLEAITHLDYPQDCFEVIVVNDGGVISLEEIAVQFQEDLNLTLLTQPRSGAAKARNIGAKQAQGEFLVFTDDDCLPDSNWLKTFALTLTASPNVLVGGRTINALPNNLYSTASQLLLDYVYLAYNSNPNNARFFTSNNIALATRKFQSIGGFATNFKIASEDREFCQRWLDREHKMLYVPEAIINHSHFLTLTSFCQQHFKYGRGAFYFYQTISDNNHNQPILQNKSYYLKLLFYPFSQQKFFSASLLTGLFILSQCATILGIFWQCLRSKKIHPYQE
ncbi:MAG: glycosyltransferase [Cyanobacteria bacterium P01_A01_bin.40]